MSDTQPQIPADASAATGGERGASMGPRACGNCGYNLAGLPIGSGTKCPECGTVVPPPLPVRRRGPVVRFHPGHLLVFIPALFLAFTFVGRRGVFGEPIGGVWLGCMGMLLFPFLSLVLPFALAFERKDVSRAEAWKEGLIIMAAAIGIAFAGLVFGFVFFGMLGG